MSNVVAGVEITRDSRRLVAVARPAGRSKHTVELYWKAVPSDHRAPLLVDTVLLASADERSRFVDGLPTAFADFVDEAVTLIRYLAAEAAAAQPKPEVNSGNAPKKEASNDAVEPHDEEVNGAELLSHLSAFLRK